MMPMPRVLLSLLLGLGAVGLSAQTPSFVHLPFDGAGNLTGSADSPTLTVSIIGSPAFDPAGISGGAVSLDGSSAIRFGSDVAGLLAGSFTFSVWLRTTQTYGWDSDPAYGGAGIIYADVAGWNYDTVPLALTGSHAAFTTGGDMGDTTLHSTALLNTGAWTHVVVTRDSVTGVRSLYINGVLDSTDTGSTGALNARNLLLLGGNDIDSRYYSGSLDDFQAYNSVISSSQVAWLYANPGLTLVPEPGTLALLGIGLGVLLMMSGGGVRRPRPTIFTPGLAFSRRGPRRRA